MDQWYFFATDTSIILTEPAQWLVLNLNDKQGHSKVMLYSLGSF